MSKNPGESVSEKVRAVGKKRPVFPSDCELERFKAEINLVELASSYGYECIRKESSRSSIVMSHPDGDKIVIAAAPDGHSIFFSVRASSSGSVIDFIMHRELVSLGGARIVLRRCLAPGYLQARSRVHYRPDAIAISQDQPAIYARWLGMQPYSSQGDGYLELRGIQAETIALFADRIRMDERGNVAFRHDDLRSLSGWEMKNRGFTGFAGGGKKALFGCKIGVPAKEPAPLLVITESAIDALSYYQLQPQPGVYLSFAGALSQDQQELLRLALTRYPAARAVAATDADAQGEKYAELLRQMRSDVERHAPPIGKDWNDTLLHRAARQ
jgi:hypothetical protein